MVKRLLIFLAVALASCGKLELQNMVLPLVPDVEDRVAASLLGSPAPQDIAVPGDYRFYAGSDIHIEDSRPVRFQAMVDACLADPYAPFYLCLGDLLFGSEHMDWVADIMSGTPGFILVGNHDLLFGLWDTWLGYFKSSTYSFTVSSPAGKDLYIMLDSASGTLGKTQSEWLEMILRDVRPGCRHCFVCVHTNIFRTDLSQFPSNNFTREETWYLLNLMARGRVDMMIAGHDHVRDVTLFDGTTYITLDRMADISPNASYLIVNVKENIDYEFVEF